MHNIVHIMNTVSMVVHTCSMNSVLCYAKDELVCIIRARPISIVLASMHIYIYICISFSYVATYDPIEESRRVVHTLLVLVE